MEHSELRSKSFCGGSLPDEDQVPVKTARAYDTGFNFIQSGYSYRTRAPTYIYRMIIAGSITLGKSYLVNFFIYTVQLSNSGITELECFHSRDQ